MNLLLNVVRKCFFSVSDFGLRGGLEPSLPVYGCCFLFKEDVRFFFLSLVSSAQLVVRPLLLRKSFLNHIPDEKNKILKKVRVVLACKHSQHAQPHTNIFFLHPKNESPVVVFFFF